MRSENIRAAAMAGQIVSGYSFRLADLTRLKSRESWELEGREKWCGRRFMELDWR